MLSEYEKELVKEILFEVNKLEFRTDEIVRIELLALKLLGQEKKVETTTAGF